MLTRDPASTRAPRSSSRATSTPRWRGPRELDDEVFLIGGAAVFDEALARDLVDPMVVTHVPLSPPGDTFFAPVDPARWTETDRQRHPGTPDYEIATYARR